VATIDAMMNLRKPNIAGYTEGLRSMLPKGPCDIEAVRKISMKSTYFRWRKVYSSGEMFRLSSKYLVSDFWIDTKTNEFSKKSISIRIKIEEADFK
jgi:hypothetical protein